MKIHVVITAAAACAALAACAETSGRAAPPTRTTARAGAAQATLPAFRSEQELGDYLRELAKEHQLRQHDVVVADGVEMEMSAPAPVSADAGGALARAEESVTNVQHAGVDEGGIVKVHGDYLVMLRRGRLFTVAIGGNQLEPVSAVDAFGPEMDPGGTWYDELLVSGNRVVVIGFSYERGGTEVGLFDIDNAGKLTYRSTYHLRSNDYYSSRNYASRLIGSKLVFYTPLYLPLWGDDPMAGFPAVRRWHPGATDEEFRRIVPATRVYRPGRELSAAHGVALHTVTVCDLATGEMECKGTAVLGPPGRVFYVSPGSVYVWVSDWRWDYGDELGAEGDSAQEKADRAGEDRAPSMLYRIPLDGGGPSALGVKGSPVDQFSFLESDDGHLNVLVRSDAEGDGMWAAEQASGDAALLRVRTSRFGDGERDAPESAYRPLPAPAGGEYAFQNRFVGGWLLYGSGSGWGAPVENREPVLYAVPWRGGALTELSLPHGVDRIENMGGDAVVVGTDGRDLHFTGVRLGGRPELAQRYVSPGASQGELRSHGFFYRPDGPGSGMLGLPIRGPGRPGHEHLTEGSASVLFLRNQASRFEELGQLAARADGTADDGCRASCVDWYGNARPLFLRGRIFALLGYEIVEGSVADGRIRETRRVSYAPRPATVAGR